MTATPGNQDTVTGEVTPEVERDSDGNVIDDGNVTAIDTDQLPPMEDQDWYDDAAGILFGKAVLLIERVNGEVDWLKENSSDLLTVIERVEQDEKDNTAKAAQDRMEALKSELLKIEQALRKYATDKAKAIISDSQDQEQVKQHETTHAAARTALRDYMKTFKSSYGEGPSPYLPAVRNMSRSGTGTGKSGGRRLRGFVKVTVDGKVAGGKVDGEFKSTFSAAAKEAKVDLGELQASYFEASGTSDKDSFPKYLEWSFQGKQFTAERADEDAS